MKKLAVVAIGLSFLCGSAMAQDAKTVIANAQKALGDVKSITYSGSAKDVAFQQCGSNAADMNCRGTHDPMRPINNYVRVIDLTAPASRANGATNNPAGGGATQPMPGTFFQGITAQQTDVAQPWGNSLEFYITPWGFLKGAAANNATVSKKKVDGKNYTVLTWSPTVKAASGSTVSGRYVMFYIPGQGGFFFASESVTGRNFIKAGYIDGNRMQFTVDNLSYDCTTLAPIAVQNLRQELWVYHDPTYRPEGNWTLQEPEATSPDAAADTFFAAAADSLDWWMATSPDPSK